MCNKSTIKEEMLKISGKILQSKVEKEKNRRWPHCVGILHQPVRPKKDMSAI